MIYTVNKHITQLIYDLETGPWPRYFKGLSPNRKNLLGQAIVKV